MSTIALMLNQKYFIHVTLHLNTCIIDYVYSCLNDLICFDNYKHININISVDSCLQLVTSLLSLQADVGIMFRRIGRILFRRCVF